MKNFLKLLIVIVLFSGCEKKQEYNYGKQEGLLGLLNASTGGDSSEIGELVLEDIDQEITVENNYQTTDRKLIKNGSIEFESFDLDNTRETIVKSLKKYQGYISSDNEYNRSYRNSIVLNVRIPSENFDDFLENISKGVEKFDERNITVSDVTEQFLDVQTRLKNKKKLEIRYLEILKKARSVKEILEVEKELGKLREDIESGEGKLKYLENQVSFSTLNITFYKTISKQSNFGRKFKNAFGNGFNNLKSFLIGLINIWPFIILIIFFIYLFKRWRNKK